MCNKKNLDVPGREKGVKGFADIGIITSIPQSRINPNSYRCHGPAPNITATGYFVPRTVSNAIMRNL